MKKKEKKKPVRQEPKNLTSKHCVKSVQIRSVFGHFSRSEMHVNSAGNRYLIQMYIKSHKGFEATLSLFKYL